MTDATDDESCASLIQKVARRIRNNRGGDDLSDSQLGVLFQLEETATTRPASSPSTSASPRRP